ncbi:MAG: HAMP domain-containing histidine kinase [Thermodesulfovibrionales bacterium]|nr:HAMP domain-containing histidine kinase [Thermodesulfovibrionales bacterium]
MKFLAFFLVCIFSPIEAWGYVPHEYPAIYTQQLGRIFLFIALLVVLWSIVHYRLHRQKGWRYLFISLIFFTIWDLDVFVGRLSEFITMPSTIGGTEGWQYFKRHIEIGRLEYLYYLGRFDFVLLNIAMFFFYLGLREHVSEVQEKNTASVSVIMPLLPILITDMAGNVIFIVLSVMSLYTSIKLYRTDKENVLWNYMVWLATAWLMFSISRSFGHIIRHVLIPTGNQDVWKFFEPLSGSFNTFSLFFVGSVSLFFIRIYKSYMEITEDKRTLERLVAERAHFIEKLERDKMELRELDKLKSAFLANMSHELRTPMNTIIGYTEALLDSVDGPVNAEQEKSLGKVKQSAKHLLKLIDDVLDVSRLESAKVKLVVTEIDLKALIETVMPSFESLIREKGLSLSLTIDETLPPVYGDEGNIKQILINLLSNAVKFTHTGGISITAHPSDDDRTHGVQPLFMEICIADTGIGIREDDLRKIFEMFMQIDFTLVRQYEGTGLGLSIAKGMVELHKGKIWATSKYGEGSRFCFTLPLQKEILVNTVVPL